MLRRQQQAASSAPGPAPHGQAPPLHPLPDRSHQLAWLDDAATLVSWQHLGTLLRVPLGWPVGPLYEDLRAVVSIDLPAVSPPPWTLEDYATFWYHYSHLPRLRRGYLPTPATTLARDLSRGLRSNDCYQVWKENSTLWLANACQEDGTPNPCGDQAHPDSDQASAMPFPCDFAPTGTCPETTVQTLLRQVAGGSDLKQDGTVNGPWDISRAYHDEKGAQPSTDALAFTMEAFQASSLGGGHTRSPR